MLAPAVPEPVSVVATGNRMAGDLMADISVIIVNYGTADLALQAAASVLDRADRVRDIHIVDNASPATSSGASPRTDAEVIAAAIAARGWAPRVTLHAERRNHGFGRGNNLVIGILAREAAPPDKVFLLNPDARLDNAATDILAEFLDDHPQVGAAGARIQKPGGIPVTAAFRFPGLISTFSDAVSFGPLSRLCARWRVPLGTDIPTARVDWVAGAAVMFRLKALLDAQMFDPAYFLYHEEVDLMRQLARKGWQTWHVAQALVVHAEGAATGIKSGQPGRRRRPSYWYQSWRHYMAKNHGRPGAVLACAAWALGAALNHAICRLRGRQPASPLHFFGDLWVFAMCPLLGLKAGQS